MKNKKTLWLSLALSIPLALSPLAAVAQQDAAPQPPPPPGQAALPPPPHAPAMDESRAAYRLTYTLTEMDGEKRVGSQHYALVLDTDAPPANLKLRARMPIYTDATAFQYIDTGLNIHASLRQFSNGIELRTKVDQTALDIEPSNTNEQPARIDLKIPIVRQNTLESSALLHEGRPVVLGSLDTPGSSRRMQITVVLSKVP